MDATMEAFERDGYAIVDPLELAPHAVDAIRADLEPWCVAQLAPSAERQWEGALPSAVEDDGWGRAGASNVLVDMADVGGVPQATLDFMLRPEMLEFTAAALRSKEFAIDDASIAGYPTLGEAGNRGSGARGGSDLHGWHRDSFNHHQHLTGFHLNHGGSDAGSSQAGGECGGPARRYARYTPPTAVNFIAYMQDSILRVVPGTHRDYTDIEGAGSGGPAGRGEDYLFGMFMEKPEGDRISVRARPHPREACVPIRRGQVVLFHSNLLHCGMLNDSPTERRYYLSIFYARLHHLGACSRNLGHPMDLVQRAPPGSPLHAVLDRALEQQDRQTLTLFGLQAKLPRPTSPPTDPFDLLVWLGAGEDQQRIIERVKGGDVRPRIAAGASDRSYLGHCSAVALLLSSWACDPPTIDAGLFASIYGSALHPGRFSIDVARRGMVAECVGEEAEAVAFANCALQLRALDAAVVRCRDALASGADWSPLVLEARHGFGAVTVTVESPRQLQMLLAVHVADWLQQAEDVDRRGFGPPDAPVDHVEYGAGEQWAFVQGGIAAGFRAEAFEAMLELLALLRRVCEARGGAAVDSEGGSDPLAAEVATVAEVARVGHALLLERLGVGLEPYGRSLRAAAL